MKKLFMFLLLGLFMISFASAWEKDNVKSYDEINRVVTITNSFGFGDVIGQAKLNTPLNVKVGAGYQKVAVFDIWAYDDYSDAIKQFTFTDMKKKEKINRDFDLKMLTYEEVEIEDYYDNCYIDISSNGTEEYVCDKILNGSHFETKEVWTKVTPADLKKNEVLTIGIFTDVQVGDHVDWIPTIYGVEVDEWAIWTQSIEVGLIGVWEFSEGVGTTSADSHTSNVSLIGTNNPGWTTAGKVGNATDLEESTDQYWSNATAYDDFPGSGEQLTFNAWVKPESLATNMQVVTKYDVPGSGTVALRMRVETTGQAVCEMRRGGNNAAASSATGTITVGNWTMITCMANSTGNFIYINGTQVGENTAFTGTLTGWSTGTDFTFGRDLGNRFAWDGLIDQAMFWNRSLNTTEIGIQLWNDSNGVAYGIQGSGANVQITLNSPANNSVIDNNITFNSTVSISGPTGALSIVNVSLLIDGIINETNSSGFLGDYIFNKNPSIGNHNWSIRVVDNSSQITNSNTRSFFIIGETQESNWTSEYQVRINSSTFIPISTIETALEINNVVATYEGGGIYKLNTTESNFEVARAQIMKTLFYGTNGNNPRILNFTNITNITTPDLRDFNRSAFYENVRVVGSANNNGVGSLDLVFSSITNNENVSSWSRVFSGTGGSSTARWEIPTGSTKNTVTGVGQTSDELGTDTSSDQEDNPSNGQLEISTSVGISNTEVRALILSNSNITNSLSDPSGIPLTASSTNFLDDDLIPFFSTVPQITLNSPANNTQLLPNSVLFNITSSVFEDQLKQISLFINDELNETINISGTTNITIFNKSFSLIGDNNWSVKVCDTRLNCIFSETRSFGIINLVEINQTFQSSITEGSLQDISALIQIASEETISAVALIYNGTTNIGSSSTVGDNIQIIKENFLTPEVATDTNITFFWSVVLSGGETFNLTSQNQTILNLQIDNCSSFTNQIMNLTMVDEEEQFLLNNTIIEVAINLLSSDRSTTVVSLSGNFENENPLGICLDQNISNATEYSLDAVILYTANNYAIEYYNIVDSTLNNESEILQIALFSLNLTDSTDFQLTFIGTDALPEENALVFVERQYIAENTFKTVEIPKTDSNGQTILHLVRNDVVYNIRVVKDGVVLQNFQNIIAFCDDFTIGSCTLNLNALVNTTGIFNYNEEIGILYNQGAQFDNDTRIISFDFVSSDGSTKIVSMNVERRDIFGNISVCSNTVVSASGTTSCNIGTELTDTSLVTIISIDGTPWLSDTVVIDDSAYGSFGYVIWFILSLALVLMFAESKNGIMISLALAYVSAVSMGIIVGGITGIGTAGIWILVTSVIGIWKINRNRKS